jgi:hypothetical protein
VVTTKQATVIKGALKEQHSNAVILTSAAIANRDQNGVLLWTPLDGDTVIVMDNIEFMQTGLDASLLSNV